MESKAVHVFFLLATAATALILDEIPSPPVASPGAAESPVPGGPPGETSYQDVQSRNVYSYPVEKQYTAYTYSGSPSSHYSDAPVGGNSDNGYSASSYQNGARVEPQYVSSFRGFSNMAIAKPYNYYISHPGEASSAVTYQEARTDINGGVQPGNDGTFRTDNSQNGNSVKTANQAFTPTDTITEESGKRSLLELISPHGSIPAPNSLSPSLYSSLTSSNFLENARVQLSFSGGYPTNSPRYTYLTFIIPGDLCTVNQQGSGLVAGASLQDSLKVGNQANGFINQQIPFGSSFSTYNSPAVQATGYGTSGQFQYGGSAVQNQGMYSNGQTVYGTLPGQTYGVNGGVVGAGGAGTFLNTLEHTGALRSLDDHGQNTEDSKLPPNPSAPASSNVKPNEAPTFAPAARSINT